MNIIVTGASRGIGYEMIKLLAKNPSNRICAIARSQEKLDELRNKCLKETGSTITTIPLDLTSNFGNELLNQLPFSVIDILINNAGDLMNKPFIQYAQEDMEQMFDSNVIAPAKLIQLLMPGLLQSKKAHVVNIGSMGGFQGSIKFSGLSFYSASKAALASLTECLAEEYKGSNVKFNCLCLGAVQTEMLNKAFPEYKAPLSAEQIARFIIDFSMNASDYLNGKVLPISLSTP